MLHLQRADIRAEWWKDNFSTLSMFEDTFKDGIEKKIDFKGVLAFIATIFQHHIPFQFNIESTILVNFNQGLVQGWKSMIFITLFCKFLLKKYKNESNYLDMTKFDALIRKRIMKKVLIELLNSKLQARVYSCWVNLSSIFQFHIGPRNLFKSSIIFSVNVKSDINWENQNK